MNKNRPRSLTLHEYDLLSAEKQVEYVDAILDAVASEGLDALQPLTEEPGRNA